MSYTLSKQTRTALSALRSLCDIPNGPCECHVRDVKRQGKCTLCDQRKNLQREGNDAIKALPAIEWMRSKIWPEDCSVAAIGHWRLRAYDDGRWSLIPHEQAVFMGGETRNIDTAKREVCDCLASLGVLFVEASR